MREPLDFSSIGGKEEAPAPPAQAPKRSRAPKQPAPKPQRPEKHSAPRMPRMGTGPSSRTIVLVLVAVAAVVLGGYLLLGRDGGGAAKTQVNLAGQSARYCDLASTFESLAPGSADASATSASQLFMEMGETVREMVAVAPSQVRADVVATVRAYRAAAQGNLTELQSASFQARRQRLMTYQQSACAGGAGSGDG